jgi:glycosyltransferase involved in cell wall biosynthesis
MRILHVLRTPIGGLFRHVCDLVRGQVALGHEVGIFCDASTGGTGADVALAKISPLCSLGITRLPMSVLPSFGDLNCILMAQRLVSEREVDVIHGHGAKGGLYARLATKRTGKPAVYTPHGGSLHYNWLAFPGFLYMATEWYLRRQTAGLAFVCEYERELFERKLGAGKAKVNVVHNGLWADEFKAVAPAANASDILFVGEMCYRKGVDVLLRSLAELKPNRKLTAAMVGDGEEIETYKALTTELGLDGQVTFHGRMGIAQALPLGKVFILPSRLESFPYVVLEVIAAGRAIVSTKVGGLGEVLPEAVLCEKENVRALSAKLTDVFDNLPMFQKVADQVCKDAPQNFSAETMVKKITDFYSRLK